MDFRCYELYGVRVAEFPKLGDQLRTIGKLSRWMCCKPRDTGLIGLALHETGASGTVQGATFRTEIIILCVRRYLLIWAKLA
jgi:hypothetical protein